VFAGRGPAQYENGVRANAGDVPRMRGRRAVIEEISVLGDGEEERVCGIVGSGAW
jgi:hypothetical protein